MKEKGSLKTLVFYHTHILREIEKRSACVTSRYHARDHVQIEKEVLNFYLFLPK